MERAGRTEYTDADAGNFGEVLISYSWDSDPHPQKVLALSDRLRSEGIDCVLDQYEVSPPEGWPRWMDRKINIASLVIVICTKTYLARVIGEEEPGKGNGVRWEGGIICQHLYNQGGENKKFIPVLMQESDKKYIPVPLQSASYFTIETEAGYQRLYSRLLGLLLPFAQMYHVRTCERSVAVHHREPGNSDPAKMLALCLACHAKVKGGRVGESLCDWSVWSVV